MQLGLQVCWFNVSGSCATPSLVRLSVGWTCWAPAGATTRTTGAAGAACCRRRAAGAVPTRPWCRHCRHCPGAWPPATTTRWRCAANWQPKLGRSPQSPARAQARWRCGHGLRSRRAPAGRRAAGGAICCWIVSAACNGWVPGRRGGSRRLLAAAGACAAAPRAPSPFGQGRPQDSAGLCPPHRGPTVKLRNRSISDCAQPPPARLPRGYPARRDSSAGNGPSWRSAPHAAPRRLLRVWTESVASSARRGTPGAGPGGRWLPQPRAMARREQR